MSRTKKDKRLKEAAPSVERRVFQEVTRTSRKQRKHPIQITYESEKIRKASLEIGEKNISVLSQASVGDVFVLRPIAIDGVEGNLYSLMKTLSQKETEALKEMYESLTNEIEEEFRKYYTNSWLIYESEENQAKISKFLKEVNLNLDVPFCIYMGTRHNIGNYEDPWGFWINGTRGMSDTLDFLP